MNALHKLSKRYAQNEFSLSSYRLKRRELIDAILAGEQKVQMSITSIPIPAKKMPIQKPLAEHEPHKAVEESMKADKQPSSIKKWVIVLMIAILSSAAYVNQEFLIDWIVSTFSS
jgi:hypothetical protein